MLPGLEVQGMDAIGLPLAAAQAAELSRHCKQAGYGKGEQTLVDTDVRRVWKLPPDRFSLTNPAWSGVLDGIQMAQPRRDHIQNQIMRSGGDLACTTDKRPRPQVLLCRKTTASFDAKLKVYRENLVFLETLRMFANGQTDSK